MQKITPIISALCAVLPISISMCGCPWTTCESREEQGVPSVVEQGQREPNQAESERHVHVVGKKVITAGEAKDIGNKHFGRARGSGVYLEDRGAYYFVAPPIKTRKELEEAGIMIRKDSGEIMADGDRIN